MQLVCNFKGFLRNIFYTQHLLDYCTIPKNNEIVSVTLSSIRLNELEYLQIESFPVHIHSMELCISYTEFYHNCNCFCTRESEFWIAARPCKMDETEYNEVEVGAVYIVYGNMRCLGN